MASGPYAGQPDGETSFRVGGELAADQLCVPVFGVSEPAGLDHVRLGLALGETTGGRVHLFDPIGSHESSAVDGGSMDPDDALAWARRRVKGDEEASRARVLSGRRTSKRILNYVKSADIDTLVLPGGVGRGPLGRRRHDRLAHTAPCNVISINGDGQYEEFASLLLAIADGPHAGLATDVATHIAERFDAYIDILHVLPTDIEDEVRTGARTRLETVVDQIDRPGTVQPWVLESDDPADTIIDQSTYYGLTVIGAPTTSRLQRFFYGSTSKAIRQEAESLVIAARAAQARS